MVAASALAWTNTAHAGGGDPGLSATDVDVARDARESGIDPDALADRLEFQAEVDAVLDPLIERYVTVFSSAGYSSDGDAYVSFVGAVPAAVAEALADHPRISARGGAALSAEKAGELNEAVAQAVAEVLPRDGELTTFVEPQTGEIDVAVAEGRAESVIEDAAVEAYQEHAPRRMRARAVRAVEVDVDPTLENVDEAISGGESMALRGTSATVCTAGFPAASGGVAGMLTAKHCPANLTVGSGDRLYNASISTANSAGDVQWHRSKVSVNATFRYDWGDYRTVAAHPVLKVGTRVCRFGAATGTGTGCDDVKYVSACTKYPNLTYTICDLAMTEGWTGSAAGDSGGPWFYGGNAYGIHSGTNSRDGASRNWFTSSRRALADMGLSAITG